MTRKTAVVLRGPPCGGKSTVGSELARQLASSVLVSLDDGWNPSERRFKKDGRYADLVSNAETLIIELGFGEPAGESFPGATREPAAWLKVLREAGRSIHLFLLMPPLKETLRRIGADRGAQSRLYFGDAARRYEPGGVCSPDAFKERIGDAYTEEVIDTSLESPEATAERILRAIRPGDGTIPRDARS
ncbi:MAG: hypothetical protein L0323_19670 [Planctomycetes bacterium]|nr:hypothetical protein [Planctomycetota bacterium]